MSNVEANPDFVRAQRLHSVGQLQDAEKAYREILSREPENISAMHLLGLLVFQQGRQDEGLALLKQSVSLVEENATLRFNYGSALITAMNFEAAIAELRRALELQPNYPEAMSNLSVALCRKGDFEDAAVVARLVLAQRPRSPEAIWNLSQAIFGQAQVAFGRGNFSQASDLFRQALSFNHNHVEALLGLGRTLAAMDDPAAEEFFHRASTLKPHSDEVCYACGQYLDRVHRREEAVDWLGRAVSLNPKKVAAKVDLAAILGELGRHGEAIPLLEEALELEPDNISAAASLGAIYSLSGRHDEGAKVLSELLEQYQSKIDGGATDAVRKNLSLAMNNLLMLRHYKEDYDAAAVFEEHRKFGQIFDRPDVVPPPVDRNPNRKLRIGYVSGDFRAHSVAFFIEPILEHHDREAFEIFLYSNARHPDLIAKRFRSLPHHWRDIDALSDRKAFEAIRADQPDILVDLAGHTSNSRLTVFGMKPAAVQATYLGYPDTTGLSTIDYRITDALADPPGETDRFYTEKLWRLPKTAWCYRPFPQAPEVAPLPGRHERGITFGCFNAARKISPTCARLWAKLLETVKDSRLILKTRELEDEAAKQRILELLVSHGIPEERLELRQRNVDMAEHLGTYNEIEVALDPYPYHGTTTTCDALYMGVPVVTLAGMTHMSRVGVSLLTNVGLPELIADTEEGYVRKAAELALDRGRLAELRSSLRERMKTSPICDEIGFTKDLEAAYRAMWAQRILQS